MEIAVMGATGNVGRELVAQLAAAGHSARALVRDPAAAPPGASSSHAVDLGSGASIRDAVDGAEGAFMLSGYDDAGLVAELERTGVRRVALLSSGSVETAGAGNAVAAYHRASERALAEADLTATFLRPNSFMTNSLRWIEAIRAGQPIEAPFADVPIACNDPGDVAAVAAVALTAETPPEPAYRITGPRALRPAEQVEVLAAALGRPLAFEPQDDASARAEMEAQMPREYVEAFFEFFVAGKLDETTVLPTVERATGRPPRRFEQWVDAHVDAFRA